MDKVNNVAVLIDAENVSSGNAKQIFDEASNYGNIIVEVKSEKDLVGLDYRVVATLNDSEKFSYGMDTISIQEAYAINKAPLESVVSGLVAKVSPQDSKNFSFTG